MVAKARLATDPAVRDESFSADFCARRCLLIGGIGAWVYSPKHISSSHVVQVDLFPEPHN